MANIMTFQVETVDFESAVDEIDVLIPKYLESLELLEEAETVDEVGHGLRTKAVYWGRLHSLFEQIQPLENSVPFESIIKSVLQSELVIIERVYLRLNLRLQLCESEWSDELFQEAFALLLRIDEVLGLLGQSKEHEDRTFVEKVQVELHNKRHCWHMRRRLQQA